MSCDHDGIAVLTARVDGPPAWERADEKIHVSAELLDNPTAALNLKQRYDLGEWCDESSAYHAMLRT